MPKQLQQGETIPLVVLPAHAYIVRIKLNRDLQQAARQTREQNSGSIRVERSTLLDELHGLTQKRVGLFLRETKHDQLGVAVGSEKTDRVRKRRVIRAIRDVDADPAMEGDCVHHVLRRLRVNRRGHKACQKSEEKWIQPQSVFNDDMDDTTPPVGDPQSSAPRSIPAWPPSRTPPPRDTDELSDS